MARFYYDYKYLKFVILITFINMFCWYDSLAIVDAKQGVSSIWSNSLLPLRYLTPYHGAVLVRYKDSTLYRLRRQRIRIRSRRCARQWKPEIMIKRFPPSVVLSTVAPSVDPFFDKVEPTKCPVGQQIAKPSMDPQDCDLSTTPTTATEGTDVAESLDNEKGVRFEYIILIIQCTLITVPIMVGLVFTCFDGAERRAQLEARAIPLETRAEYNF